MKITKTLLKRKGACRIQLALFASYYPKGVVVTRELCLKHAHEFDWSWGANHLLSAPASKAYDEAMVPARKAFREAMVPARKAFRAAMVPARKAYEEVMAPASKAYEEAMALAFADAAALD